MKILCLLLLSISFYTTAQTNIDYQFDSPLLSETRAIHIHLPASYNSSHQSYPVIYSFDGEYTQFVVNGNVDYYSFLDKIPECIVVSIDQNYMDTVANNFMRWLDCSYSNESGLPENKGIVFKDFITKELVPYIDKTYRTTNFKTIIGHSYTANFVNYFLMDEEPIFQGYIAISPFYASNSLDSLKTIIEKIDHPIFYYVASGEKDFRAHIASVNEFDKQFSEIENNNFNYGKFDLEGNKATHYSIFPIAMPHAIEHIFSLFGPINDTEYKRISKIDNKFDYLVKRYANIRTIYGLDVKIRDQDFNDVAYLIAKKKQWSQLKQLGELAVKIYPETFSGYYILGEYEEQMGNYDLALAQFELGFSKLGDECGNKEDFQIDIDRVKAKIK